MIAATWSLRRRFIIINPLVIAINLPWAPVEERVVNLSIHIKGKSLTNIWLCPGSPEVWH